MDLIQNELGGVWLVSHESEARFVRIIDSCRAVNFVHFSLRLSGFIMRSSSCQHGEPRNRCIGVI